MYLFFLAKTAHFSPGILEIKHVFMHGKIYPETHSPAKHCISSLSMKVVCVCIYTHLWDADFIINGVSLSPLSC